MKNKWFIGLLTILYAMIPLTGCDQSSFTSSSSSSNILDSLDHLSVWSVEDTFKVHADGEYTAYMDKKASIEISAVRNEYENAQIILTPEQDVASYAVSLQDLKDSSGTIFKKENFTVYHEKYIDVSQTTTTRFTAGSYPDALLPLSVATEYGENKIKEGENQGIWFECYIPKGQKDGTYTGSFLLTVDGKTMSVPVTLTIYDYTLSDTVHSRSSFGIHRYWNEGGIVSAEKDASYEMYEKYYEYLLNHRISARYLPASMTDIDGFITEMVKYVPNEKCSNYILPYVSKWDNELAGTGIDYDLYEQLLDQIALQSVLDSYNYLAKASTYFAMFDEITSDSMINLANKFYSKILNLHFKIAKKWETSLNCEASFKQELIETMLSINQLMVTTYSQKFANQVTFCPLLDKYDDPSSKANYASTYVISDPDSSYTIYQNQEKWWYSAGIPKNPYASYHIDDNGYSPIVYSWMQYANDVVGNLYWSATFYLVRTTENNKVVYNTLQDCYTTAMRFPSTNGDGFLVYPGAPYGISGPVGSIRLQQILDGLEEYDMLYALEEKYDQLKENGVDVDFDQVMNFFYERLFSGTKVGTSEEMYETMRERLISLLTLAENEGVLITNASLNSTSLQAEIFVPEGKNVQYTGVKENEVVVANGSVHHVRMELKDQMSDFVITSGSHQGKLLVNARYIEYSGSDLNQLFTINNGTVSYEEDGARLQFPASSDKRHSFTFSQELNEKIHENISTIEMNLISDDACLIEVLFTGSKSAVAIPVYNGNLSVGDNQIAINISTLNWASLGELQNVTIRFGSLGDQTAREIKISLIAIK